MSHIDDFDYYKEARTLTQLLKHHLVSLASSVEARLSPAEADILANLFQVQINLQRLLDERMSEADLPSFARVVEEEKGEGYKSDSDSIAYAQAIQYARDLVKAIQQKKEQQRRLELTSQQLIRAEKLATVGPVAATVAHELGNILTPLLMYAKLIRKEADDHKNQEIAEFANRITRIANRASDMVRQLVDVARSERAMMIPIDLTVMINNALHLLSPQIDRQNIKIQLKYPHELPLVLGRPDQLEQVFINMGLNALDAMPDGGDFFIELKPDDGTDDQLEKTKSILVCLRDTGIGIPSEAVALLFEPFYTTKERGAGSGLGLFVSYLIIDQHGGTIEVESQQGQGTTFTIKLPITNSGEAD